MEVVKKGDGWGAHQSLSQCHKLTLQLKDFFSQNFSLTKHKFAKTSLKTKTTILMVLEYNNEENILSIITSRGKMLELDRHKTS